MIKANGICKAYGPIAALEDVSFEIDAGEVVGLLGPNGLQTSVFLRKTEDATAEHFTAVPFR